MRKCANGPADPGRGASRAAAAGWAAGGAATNRYSADLPSPLDQPLNCFSNSKNSKRYIFPFLQKNTMILSKFPSPINHIETVVLFKSRSN